jgi:hypothetical protein
MKCPRCKGKGNVYLYLRAIFECDCDKAFDGCLCFLMLFLFISAFIGGIIGIIIFYFLKTLSDTLIFKIIFYIITGFFFLYMIAIIVYGFEEPFNIWLVNIFIGLSVGNYFIGDFFCKNSGSFINFLGGLYSFLQTAGVGFFISYKIFRVEKKVKLTNTPNKFLNIKCPLCKGNKVISISEFEKYERCSKCTGNCGYGKSDLCSKRYFCVSCSGIGYHLKKENIEIN